jgi:hypothetical protein
LSWLILTVANYFVVVNINCCQLLFVGGIHFDQPFGLKTAHWDENAPTAVELQTLLKQFDAINTNPANHFVLFNCDWRKTAVPYDVLIENNYKVNPLFWYKTDQNVVGDNKDLTYSVEEMLLGFKRGTGSDAVALMDPDPRKRHNLIQGPALHTLQRYADGSIVNVHEKPEYVAKWVTERYTVLRDWVIVMGGGAGGDARGYLKNGCNVVVIESDPKQFAHLCAQMATLEANQDILDAKAEKQASEVAPKAAANAAPKEAESLSCPGCGTKREKPPWVQCINCPTKLCRACMHCAKDADRATVDPCCSKACLAIVLAEAAAELENISI